MRIPQHTPLQELRMNIDQALRVESTAHVIHVGLPLPTTYATVDATVLGFAERVEGPCEVVFGVGREEGSVGGVFEW